jgi:Fic family protein
MLCHDSVIQQPLLYPSLYFRQHREAYYRELNAVRDTGDYEHWIDFFAEALRHSAEVAVQTGRRVIEVFHQDREELRKERSPGNYLLIQEALQSKPVSNIAALTQKTGLTTPTVTSVLNAMLKRGMVKETTGKARGRIFAYKRYLEAMASEDM